MNTRTQWEHRLSNWGCGALTALSAMTVGAVVLAGYRVLEAHGLHAWPRSPVLSFIVAFIVLDVVYYWHHRAEHQSRVLWAIHAVHHQSRWFDTSVSLRTSALAPVVVFISHLPLAAIGLPLATYLAAYSAHAALIFLLHSRTPVWMNRAGRVLNSPYLHRGHHSTAPSLRGKNLGGVFIVWDRMFGTYEPRCEVSEFGIGSRETPLNPIAANVGPWRALWR